MNEAVRTEIESLREQAVNVLRLRYRELFGEDTESTSHPHLLRRIAWRLQAAEEGDLTERARQRAAELIADVDLRLNARPSGGGRRMRGLQPQIVIGDCLRPAASSNESIRGV